MLHVQSLAWIIELKFETVMLQSSCCGYNDTYILVKETIIVFGRGADTVALATDKIDQKVIFKNSATFTDCIKEIYNTQADNAKDVLIEHSVHRAYELKDHMS